MPTTIYKNKNGNRLKSVTGITKYFGDKGGMIHAANKLGLEGSVHYREWSELAKLGTLVHRVCQHNLTGDSIDDAVDKVVGDVPMDSLDWFANCVAAWMQCRQEVIFGKALSVEQHMVSEKWQYGGTPDAIIAIGAPAVMDVKTGGVFPETAMQLAAYRQLYNENMAKSSGKVRCGYVVQLNRESGAYKLHCYPEAVLDVGWRWFRAVQVAVDMYDIVKAGTK